MLSLGYNQLSLGNLFLQKCTGGTVIFTETQAWPWHWWKKNLKFCEFFWNILKKPIWKKISEPQNIDHTTQSDLHTFWLVLAMVFGEMNFVIWCCMLSHFLKKVFLQCRCYQGWFQYPSSWKKYHNYYELMNSQILACTLR